MKIALILNPWFELPPRGYAGTERIVYSLAEELVKRKHEVIVYTVGSSKISAKKRFVFEKPFGKVLYSNPYIIIKHLHYAFKDILKEKPDIVHLHTALVSFYFIDLLSQFVSIPSLITLHTSFNKERAEEGNKMIKYARETAVAFKNYNYISISNKQREALPQLNYVKTIYHGIPIEKFKFNPVGSNKIVWLGRLYKHKGLHTVLKIAIKHKFKVKFAFAREQDEPEYYRNSILPLIKEANKLGLTEQYPEIKTETKKSQFLGDAKFFLFPLTWDEPFGLVIIESLASGTPVIAYKKGSLPEIIKDGETGFLVDPNEGEAGLIKAIKRIYELPQDKYLEMRKRCRQVAEDKYTVQIMTDNYLEVYKLIAKS